MTDEFRKVLDLIKRTNEKLVFYDSGSDSSFIILPIDKYQDNPAEKESISNLTEEELLAKINRDVARWRSEQNLEKVGEAEKDLVEKLNRDSQFNQVDSGEEIYQFEPIEEENS